VVNLRGLPADFRPEVPANRGNIDELVHQATTRIRR
jgi:outer membrane protein